MRRVNRVGNKNKIRLMTGFVLLVVFLTVPFLTPMGKYLSIPNKIITSNNHLPISVPDLGDNITVDASNDTVQTSGTAEFTSNESGECMLMYQDAGLPIKKVNVSVLDDLKIVPSGKSIGVQLHTKGVHVVGFHRVQTDEGSISPAENAKIKAGDIILKINENTIKNVDEVRPLVTKAGKNNKALDLTIKRGDETFNTKLN